MKHARTKLALALSLLIGSACATTPAAQPDPGPEPAPAREIEAAPAAQPEPSAASRPSPSTADPVAVSASARHQAVPVVASATVEHHASSQPASPSFDIPVVDHPTVDVWMDYFTGPGARRFRGWLERLGRYAPLMQPMLAEAGVPRDTIYLALIESGLSSRAYSRARASGYWQFIERTGRAYGLQQDFWVDERRDPVKATRAAAAHLKDLHDEFGDWHLAWAGYNAGSGKIRTAIKRYGTRDFFELIEHPYLRRETKEYVPKLIAAARIAKDPERYGFTGITPLPAFASEPIVVGDATDLGLVADGCGVEMEVLADLNPELRRWATPPHDAKQPPYRLRVPQGLGEKCKTALDAVPANKRLTFRHHRVRSGEVPGKIARRYGISLKALMQINKIRDARRMRVGQDLIIPIPARVPERMFRSARVQQRPGDDGLRKPAAAQAATSKPAGARGKVVAAAKKPAPRPAKNAAPRKVAAPDGTRPVTHTVEPGDNLWVIARRYGVSVAKLKVWNGFRKTPVLQPGQELTVHISLDS